PGMQHPLVVDELVAGTSNVIHDLVLPAILQSAADLVGEIVEHFVPGNALPLSFAALSGALQGIQNALRIVDLIDGGRTFRAVTATASGMLGISLELLNFQLLFVHVS